MAFYTSRVDHDGNEIERRSLRIPTIAMSSEDSESTSDTGFDYDFEAQNFSDNCSLSREMSMSDTASEFDYGAKNSICDSLSLNEKMSMFDRDGSDIVPPLDIRSEINFSTGNQLTYKSKRKYETAKIIMEPNKHVEDWLARKRQRQLDAVARQKREAEEKRQQAEERKRLAEEKYQKWLERKKSNSSNLVVPGAVSNRKPTPQPVATAAPKRNISAEISSKDKKKKLEEWMRNKQKQENDRRLREQMEEQKRVQQEAARKQLNVGAHEKWLERNKNAPKPVPLNQGLATLRGTVSKIFVNPNEWRTD